MITEDARQPGKRLDGRDPEQQQILAGRKSRAGLADLPRTT